ncbi:MAG: DUF2950 family protein [Planctomycetota bacterium]
MEDPKTRPEVAPKSCGLATASMILGIISLILCFLVIPGLLAIIFGIIALVKINQSPPLGRGSPAGDASDGTGALTGKGKAIAGIVMGGVSFVLIPITAIIAAIALPNLLSSRIATNETIAMSNLRVMVSCEAMWRQQDADMNGIKDYWTYDVSSFYRMYRSDKTTLVHAIDISLAKADAAPAEDNIFGQGILEPFSMQTKMPKTGYLFRAMLTDENGALYNQEDSHGVRATNTWKFAFVAYPAKFGKTGIMTFIVNEAGTVYAVDTGNDTNKVILQWPGSDPTTVEIRPGVTWRVAE